MILQQKTLEKLRQLINEETEYRSGPKLVAFFNDLGFKDSYGQGFPSRWAYTDERLSKINGTPEIDKCIKKTFAPVNFIGKFNELDKFIAEFNQYLAFDEWKIIRTGTEILFAKTDKIDFEEKTGLNENDFLNREFREISLDELGLEGTITEVIRLRLDEIKKVSNSQSSIVGNIFVRELIRRNFTWFS